MKQCRSHHFAAPCPPCRLRYVWDSPNQSAGFFFSRGLPRPLTPCRPPLSVFRHPLLGPVCSLSPLCAFQILLPLIVPRFIPFPASRLPTVPPRLLSYLLSAASFSLVTPYPSTGPFHAPSPLGLISPHRCPLESRVRREILPVAVACHVVRALRPRTCYSCVWASLSAVPGVLARTTFPPPSPVALSVPFGLPLIPVGSAFFARRLECLLP